MVKNLVRSHRVRLSLPVWVLSFPLRILPGGVSARRCGSNSVPSPPRSASVPTRSNRSSYGSEDGRSGATIPRTYEPAFVSYLPENGRTVDRRSEAGFEGGPDRADTTSDQHSTDLPSSSLVGTDGACLECAGISGHTITCSERVR